MPSLAILFHLADWADGQMRDRIPAVSIESARLAALWTDYLELHARKIYAGVLNPDLQAAHLLLKKIEQGKSPYYDLRATLTIPILEGEKFYEGTFKVEGNDKVMIGKRGAIFPPRCRAPVSGRRRQEAGRLGRAAEGSAYVAGCAQLDQGADGGGVPAAKRK